MSRATYACPAWCEVTREEHDREVDTVGGYSHRADLRVYGLGGYLGIGRFDDRTFQEDPDHRAVLLQIPEDELNPQQARSLARALLAAADMADNEAEPHPQDVAYRKEPR